MTIRKHAACQLICELSSLLPQLQILEKSLRILFETKDVSKVKLFVQRQFQKIMRNKASLQDLTFAKEFRGVSGYKPGAVVPALELTRSEITRGKCILAH